MSEKQENGSEASAEEQPKKAAFDRSIVEGPLGRAVWKIAWPTMLTNVVAGVQGMIDHILVGNLVGYKANAAMGISFQIFLTVVVFISSIFIGMSVHVARYAGAGNKEKVDRTVYQAFLTAVFIGVFIMAPVGYFAAPYLLDLVNSDVEVKAEALPFLRVTFVFSIGLMIYFMTSGSLRSAGDSRTPMALGIVMTILNLVLNVILIRGLGPIPEFGTVGSAIGSSIAAGSVGIYAIYKLATGGWVVHFPRGSGWGPDWAVIRSLFAFGLPAGFQGIAMNIGGLLMFYFIGTLANSAAAQAAYALSYGQLFLLVTWSANGLMGASAAVAGQLFLLVTWSANGLMGASAAVAGQNLGAKQPDRAYAAVNAAARFGLIGSAFFGLFYFFFPQQLLAIFGMTDTAAVGIGIELLQILAFSGLFISVALAYTGGLQGTGDTKGPLYISLISQVAVPIGICLVISNLTSLQPIHIWLAILTGHMTRCSLSVFRFRQGKWRSISVDIHSTT